MNSDLTKNILIAGILGFLAVSAQAGTRVAPFVGAAATYTDTHYKSDDLVPEDTKAFGFTVSGGVVVNDHHTFTLGLNHTKFSRGDYDVFDAGLLLIGEEYKQLTFTLNYRYSIELERLGGIKIGVGPTVGVMRETHTATNTELAGPIGGLPFYKDDISSWLPVFGGELVISKDFANGFGISAGVQLLRVNSHSYDHGTGYRFEFEDATRVSYNVGVTYRW